MMEGSTPSLDPDLSAAGIFNTSLAAFRDSLRKDQLKELDQIQTVKKTFFLIRDRYSQHRNNNRLLSYYKRLKKFLKSFKLYFSIINIFI